MAARLAHYQKVGGSNPSPAIHGGKSVDFIYRISLLIFGCVLGGGVAVYAFHRGYMLGERERLRNIEEKKEVLKAERKVEKYTVDVIDIERER